MEIKTILHCYCIQYIYLIYIAPLSVPYSNISALIFQVPLGMYEICILTGGELASYSLREMLLNLVSKLERVDPQVASFSKGTE